jgi:hypothetical protein
MLTHCQRFGQRRVQRVEPGRHRSQQHLLQHHVLGEPARVAVGVADGLGPLRAQHHRHGAHRGADRDHALGVGAVVEDLRGELVTEDQRPVGLQHVAAGDAARERRELREVLAGVQVGPADAAGDRPHQHLTGARHRVGHLGHLQASGAES